MMLEEAQKFVGKEVTYHDLKGKLIRVAHPFGIEDGGMIIGAVDNGMVVNIELLKFLDDDGQWKDLT